MSPEKILNFVLGLFIKIDEDKNKFVHNVRNEYSRILTIGTNNNSSEAMAIRETTEMIFTFIEDMKDGSR